MLKSAKFVRSGLLSISTYCFCHIPELPMIKLREYLNKQIGYEQQYQDKLSNIESWLKNHNWTVRYQSSWIQLNKTQPPYEVRIMFNAQAPYLIPEIDEMQQIIQGKTTQKLSDSLNVIVFIKRQGGDKSLKVEYLVDESQVNLVSTKFVEDSSEEWKDRSEMIKRQRIQHKEINSQVQELEPRLVGSIQCLVYQMNVTYEMFNKMREMSFEYEQKLYLQWLKDMRSLL